MRTSIFLTGSPLHVIRVQICSVQDTDVVCRYATALPHMMGKKVEIHPSKERAPTAEITDGILKIPVALLYRTREGEGQSQLHERTMCMCVHTCVYMCVCVSGGLMDIISALEDEKEVSLGKEYCVWCVFGAVGMG